MTVKDDYRLACEKLDAKIQEIDRRIESGLYVLATVRQQLQNLKDYKKELLRIKHETEIMYTTWKVQQQINQP